MRLHNYILTVLFGLLGLAALYAALFVKGASHQFLMAFIGIAMSITLYFDTKKIAKR